MEYHPVGQSRLTVSRIAYGNWLTHGGYTDDSVATRCVAAALDAGITTFDTADIYADGRAEGLLGTVLSTVRRNSVIISTKVGLRFGRLGHDKDLSRQHIRASCHQSLRRLGTDYIDLYQAHRFDDQVPLEETMDALAELVRRGDVRYVGVSEWTPAQLRMGQNIAQKTGIDLVSNQSQYSMLWRVIEPDVIPTCIRMGVGQIVFSPLAQGVLTGKYLHTAPWPEESRATVGHRTGSITRFMSGELLERVQLLRPIADTLGLSMAQLGVAWVLQCRGVVSAVIGASNPRQIRENAAAADVELDTEVMRQIDLVLGDIVDRDPAKVGKTYDVMPRWRLAPEPG